MLSNILDRISFWSLFLVIVLLPLFFIPFSRIPAETSKSLLLVVGLAVSVIFWAAARFSDGKVVLPKSWIISSVFLITLVMLISAVFSSSPQVSLFGIMFDPGTFWFMFATFLLMLLSSVIIRDSKKAMMVVLGLTCSIAVVFIFQAFRFFMPQTLSLGIFGEKTDNMVGAWNTFGILAGFAGIMSLFVIEFFKVSKALKWILGFLLVLSLIMLMAVNFSLVWELIGLIALIIFVYKISISAGKTEENNNTTFPILSFAIVIISLLFFMSGQFVGGLLPNKLGIRNVEIRPSVVSTLQVGKSSLMKDPILGVGPNKFNEIWSMYKPSSINATRFWGSSFASGSGLLPTMAITSGVLGILSWLLFLVLFIFSGAKMLFANIKKGISSEITLYFLLACYLFFASIFYSSGMVVMLTAFACVGIFVGLSSATKEGKTISFSFLSDPRKSFFSIFLLILLMVVASGMSFKFIERFASVGYFGKVFAASDITIAENSIGRALLLNQNDLYYRTAMQVYIAKINTLLNKESALTEKEKADLQSNFDTAQTAANKAVGYNPNNEVNHESLGALYQLAMNLGVEGASTKALESYSNASLLNPLNPGIKLSIARLHLSSGNREQALIFAKQAIELKPDYLEGLVVISQIERSNGNSSMALSYAEQALSLAPTDQSLIQYVNTLKGLNTPKVSVPEEDTNQEKQ